MPNHAVLVSLGGVGGGPVVVPLQPADSVWYASKRLVQHGLGSHGCILVGWIVMYNNGWCILVSDCLQMLLRLMPNNSWEMSHHHATALRLSIWHVDENFKTACYLITLWKDKETNDWIERSRKRLEEEYWILLSHTKFDQDHLTSHRWTYWLRKKVFGRKINILSCHRKEGGKVTYFYSHQSY